MTERQKNELPANILKTFQAYLEEKYIPTHNKARIRFL